MCVYLSIYLTSYSLLTGNPDLGLSATHNIDTNGSQVSVVLVLIVLIATVFFLFSLTRLCLFVFRGDRRRPHRTRAADMVASGGYAVPRKPIRVVTAQDEEVVASDEEGVSSNATPPEYGRWRGSVVSTNEQHLCHRE
jgi:hypothetical protein